jgi:hypothetical protein
VDVLTGRSGIIRSLGLAMLVLSLLVGIARDASANQSGPGVGTSAQNMVVLCQLGGGTSSSIITRTVGGIQAATVRCVGGMYDGLVCSFFSGLTICTWPGEGVGASGGAGWRPKVVVNSGQIKPAEVLASDGTAEPGVVQSTESESSLPVTASGATEVVEKTATPEPTTTSVESTNDTGAGQTGEMPEDEVVPVSSETPVIENTDLNTESIDVYVDAPIVEVTFEAAP